MRKFEFVAKTQLNSNVLFELKTEVKVNIWKLENSRIFKIFCKNCFIEGLMSGDRKRLIYHEGFIRIFLIR